MSKLGVDLVILGAPAAGKDTQADRLLKKYTSARAVRSGQYWRRIAKQQTPEGALLRRTMGRGYAAPVSLMKKFINRQLKSVKPGVDLIFVGNPRLVPEARLLNRLLTQKGRDYIVVTIDLPDKLVKDRSMARQRDAQDKKFVNNRIKMYKLQVGKTLKYFKSINKLAVINGNQAVPQVTRQIISIINDYKRSKANRPTQRKRPHTG